MSLFIMSMAVSMLKWQLSSYDKTTLPSKPRKYLLQETVLIPNLDFHSDNFHEFSDTFITQVFIPRFCLFLVFLLSIF